VKRAKDAVAGPLRGADPLRLVGAGAPDDEYEPKVGTILPRLSEAHTVDDVRRVLHDEFGRWFGADVAGLAANYAVAAQRIWDEWSRHAMAEPTRSF
jgi:hypothetical protein